MYLSKTTNSEYGKYKLDSIIPKGNHLLHGCPSHSHEADGSKFIARRESRAIREARELGEICTHAKYPSVDKHGASNPIYRPSSMDLGIDVPEWYHIPERRYSRTHKFTKSFLGGPKTATHMKTCHSLSNVHAAFDRYDI